MTKKSEDDLRQAFRACARQYYRLCATHRVVGSGARASRLLPDPARLDALRERLEALSAQLREWMPGGAASEFAAALESVASDVDACADEILAALPQLDLALLRGCMPGLLETARKDVESFLDLCVGRPSQIPSLIQLIEYLVTALATEEHAGQRRVVCDPTTLTARITKITESRSDETSHDLQVLVSEAISDLAAPDRVQDVIQRMRDQKARLNERFFVPDVMRAVVEFNVAVGNRLDELSAAQRILDETEAETAFDLDKDLPTPKEPPKAPPSGEGLAEVLRALRDRLQESGLPAGPAGCVASMINTSDFTLFERRMLSSDASDPIAKSVRTVMVLGLILRHRRLVQPDLEELGVDCEQLESVWVPHAREALRGHISSEIAGGRYHDSRPLALVLTRYLPGATDAQRELTRRSREREAGQTREIDEPRASHGPAKPERRPARASRQSKPSSARLPRTKVAALVVLLAVMAGVVVNLVVSREANVTALTPAELAQISPYLVSGGRDASGEALIGTLDGDWVALGPKQRSLHAAHIEKALRGMRVRNAMLFDENRRLQMHYAGDRVAHLRKNR